MYTSKSFRRLGESPEGVQTASGASNLLEMCDPTSVGEVGGRRCPMSPWKWWSLREQRLKGGVHIALSPAVGVIPVGYRRTAVTLPHIYP